MKQLKILLILLLAAFISACSNDDTYEPKTPDIPRVEGREGDALIWRVTSDTATIYLVGTIHIGNEDLYPMQQVLLDAFYRSDALAVEFDLVSFERDVQAQLRMIDKMMLEDTTVKDHLSPETFALLESYLEGRNAIERSILLGMRVGALTMTLMQEYMMEWGWFETRGVDQFFLDLAHELGMKIIEVESPESQMEMLFGFSDELNELQLREILDATEEDIEKYFNEEMNRMLNIWINGDADALRELLDETNREMERENPRLFEEYNTAMMINRDIAMAARIVEMLAGNQTIFFAVGAAHMVAENGIIELLTEKGWTVERVR